MGNQHSYLNELDSKQCKIIARTNNTGHVECSDGKEYAVYLGEQKSNMKTGQLFKFDREFKRFIYEDTISGKPDWIAGQPIPGSAGSNLKHYNLVLIRNQ